MKYKMKKIAIMTWYNHENCGGNLQAYALSKFLTDRNYSLTFINVSERGNKYIYFLKRIIKYMLALLGVSRYGFTKFQMNNFSETFPYYSYELSILDDKYDYFICGSDQIWAPNVFRDYYYLNFITTKDKKIAYAPSIGLNEIPLCLEDKYRNLIKQFKAVSVREYTGKKLLEKIGVEAKVVLDPTFLIKREQYEELIGDVCCKRKYIFCYFLNEKNNYKNAVLEMAKRYNLDIIMYSKKADDALYSQKYIKYINPKLFLEMISGAEHVFTDSYHGTIFSIIFRREFTHLLRFEATDRICQNSRVYDLLNMLGLEERIYNGKMLDYKIGYDLVEKKLSFFRDESCKYLVEALNESH